MELFEQAFCPIQRLVDAFLFIYSIIHTSGDYLPEIPVSTQHKRRCVPSTKVLCKYSVLQKAEIRIFCYQKSAMRFWSSYASCFTIHKGQFKQFLHKYSFLQMSDGIFQHSGFIWQQERIQQSPLWSCIEFWTKNLASALLVKLVLGKCHKHVKSGYMQFVKTYYTLNWPMLRPIKEAC